MNDRPSGNDAPSDESLAEAAGRDVPGAFDALARRYQVPLLRFLRRCGGDAEDVLQETFARLFVGRRVYRPGRPFRTWAFTIARRAAVDHARARAARPTPEPSPRPDVADPHRLAAAADERRSIWATAARACTPEQVQAMWLFYGESLSAREVAAVMGTTGLGARALLSRGRRRLRDALAKADEGETVPRTAAREATV